MSGLIKPVFASPSALSQDSVGGLAVSSGNMIDNLITRHSFPEDVSKSLTTITKEEHIKRVKNLRKELDYVERTNWQYEPIEKLLGQ